MSMAPFQTSCQMVTSHLVVFILLFFRWATSGNSWSIEFKRSATDLSCDPLLGCHFEEEGRASDPYGFSRQVGFLGDFACAWWEKHPSHHHFTVSENTKLKMAWCFNILFAVIFRWHSVFSVVLKMTAMIFSIAEVSRKRPVSGASNYSNRCGGTVVWGRLWGMLLGWIKPQVEHFNLFGLNVLVELWLKATLLACD